LSYSNQVKEIIWLRPLILFTLEMFFEFKKFDFLQGSRYHC